MLQDAAHNHNNRIAIGALIYVKTRRATDSKAVGHAQPTALPSSPRPYRAPIPHTVSAGLSNWQWRGGSSYQPDEEKHSVGAITLKLLF